MSDPPRAMSRTIVTAIVSGAQTGADRGGLDAAIQLGLGWGGWAPKGWRAEDGEIPLIYREHMRASSQVDYKLRTRLNIQDSDGTLIVSFGPLSGGSEYTAERARATKKPCKHLQLPARGETRIPDAVRSAVLAWVDASRISILNVAGPRESKEPGIQQAVRDALVWIFEDEIVEPMFVTAVTFDADGVEGKTEVESNQGDFLISREAFHQAWRDGRLRFENEVVPPTRLKDPK